MSYTPYFEIIIVPSLDGPGAKSQREKTNEGSNENPPVLPGDVTTGIRLRRSFPISAPRLPTPRLLDNPNSLLEAEEQRERAARGANLFISSSFSAVNGMLNDPRACTK